MMLIVLQFEQQNACKNILINLAGKEFHVRHEMKA